MDGPTFARLPQVVVHVGGRVGVGGRMVGEELARAGLQRTVRVVVPHFLAAARVVAESDAAAMIPGRLAMALQRGWGLRTAELPFEPPRIPIVMGWHERTEADPGARFFRDVVPRALADPPARG